eukprot:8245000-Lingulodinium_polyedra.AAC.1
MRSGLPVAAPYVDNANVLGTDARRVDGALDAVKSELDAVHLTYHDEILATDAFATLGISIDGPGAAVYPSRERFWLLNLALGWVLFRGRTSGA